MFTFENNPFFRMGARDKRAGRESYSSMSLFPPEVLFKLSADVQQTCFDAYRAGWDSIA